MSDTVQMIETYSESYCNFLEATYGKNMMSEGGEESIENMFAGIDLRHKTILDIGSGLGGPAFYLAEIHQAIVFGVDLSEWMVQQAHTRTPAALKDRVDFFTYLPPTLPFDDNCFEIVYSKEVFVHVKDKEPLFKEILRVLKPNGLLVINDWLSPTQNCWGDNIAKMATEENLLLYAETETSYKALLEASGFKDIKIRDENKNYVRFNRDIVNHLAQKEIKAYLEKEFGAVTYRQALDSYHIITKAINDNELLVRSIIGKK